MCLVGSAVTLQKAKVEMSMPRKRGAAAAGFDTAYKNFLDRVRTCSPVSRNQCRLRFGCLGRL